MIRCLRLGRMGPLALAAALALTACGRDSSAPDETPESKAFRNAEQEKTDRLRAAATPPAVKARLLEADAATLFRTLVVPHAGVAIPEGKSALWCASFQLAWQAMADEVMKGPVELGPPAPPDLVDAMNLHPFPRAALDPASVLARAGLIRDGIVPSLRKELKERFGAEMLDPGPLDPRGAVAYGFLRRCLPFEHPFDPAFGIRAFAGGSRKIAAFGIQPGSRNPDAAEIRRQVRVLKAGGGEGGKVGSFVLEIAVKGGADRLLLALAAPGPTLAETWESVRPALDTQGHPLDEGDTLLVPKMNLLLSRTFGEFEGAHVLRGPMEGQGVTRALQTVRLSLDEGGAELESHAVFAMGLGVPTLYLLDRPFLLALVQKGRTEPYLLLWVANDEILAEAP